MRPDIYIKSIMKLTLQQAELIEANYQSLKGKIFMHPLYGKCVIDFVENFKLKDGSYTLVLKNNIYKEPSIPEIYGYKMDEQLFYKYSTRNTFTCSDIIKNPFSQTIFCLL
jgi:hypothetical protein